MLTKSQKAWIAAHVAATVPCVQRASKDPTFGDIFVAMPGGFLCQDCVMVYRIDVGSDAVEVWQVGSEGWIGPCICSSCSLSIPVVVNGKKA